MHRTLYRWSVYWEMWFRQMKDKNAGARLTFRERLCRGHRLGTMTCVALKGPPYKPPRWMKRAASAALVALPLALSGCGAVVTGISVAAGISTLLKNENNCTLITIADCQFPKLSVTQVVVAPEPPKVVVLSPPPVFVPMTMEPVPNPSRR